MKRSWKNILCLFCSCCFCSSAKADDLDQASSAYLSDKKYAKNIEVKAYFVTRDQILKVFSKEQEEVTQKPNKELYGREVFLLLRCKNIGDYRSFGTINCKIPNRGGPIQIEVMMMPGYMKSYYDSVIQIYEGIIPNDDKTPNITYEWKNLYTI
jgi:hypothetical protein